jgi:prephenate dehydrogenase/chorismate mutase
MSGVHRNQAQIELEQLRKQILDVTLEILQGVSKRQELARKVARLKAESGLAIENLAVEEKLKATIEEYARNKGLESRLTSQIADILISSSKIEQRREVFSRRILDFLDRTKIKSVSVIGAGRMGGWFARYFKGLKLDVCVYDRKEIFARRKAKELHCRFATDYRSVLDSDLNIVAVPISQTGAEIKKICRQLTDKQSRPKAIFEISSVKQTVLQSFENTIVPIVSIHPLFGPSTNEYAQNSIAIVNLRGNSRKDSNISLQLLKGLFPQYSIIQFDAFNHDREMALKLSLPHALALVFARVLSADRRSLKIGAKLDTPSFGAMKEITRKVLSENPEVYYEIQTTNKFTSTVLKDLEVAIKEFKEIVELQDRVKFKKLFDLSQRRINSSY